MGNVFYLSFVFPFSCSLEEECAVSICSQTLEDKNMQVHKALQLFTNALTNVETYVALLAAQSKLIFPYYQKVKET